MAALQEFLQGLSQHDWVTVYVAAVVLSVLAALALRRLTLRGLTTENHGATPAAYAVAYTTGGPERAILAALATLRAKDLIAVTETRTLTAVGARPDGIAGLDRAVYDAINARHVPVPLQDSRDLLRRWVVRDALAVIRAELLAAGVLVRLRTRALTRVWALLPLVALLALFWAADVAGAGSSSLTPPPLTGVWALIAAVTSCFSGLASLALLSVPPVTRAARKGVAELRRRHGHLAPAYSPSFTTYGANDAAMAVALFGPAALSAAYPDFALMVAPQQRRDSASTCGSDASTCGESSCGGGCGGD